MKLVVASTLFTMLVACGSHSSERTPSCDERAADLKSYLAQVFDPSAKPAPPWPTGDAELDKLLDEKRANLRAVMAETSADKTRPLEGFKRGPVDETLDRCPPARDAVAHLAAFPEPDHLTKAANAIGAGVAACKCNVDIPLLRAAFYLMARGPD